MRERVEEKATAIPAPAAEERNVQRRQRLSPEEDGRTAESPASFIAFLPLKG